MDSMSQKVKIKMIGAGTVSPISLIYHSIQFNFKLNSHKHQFYWCEKKIENGSYKYAQ